MSGIVGIAGLDGAPAEEALLRRLTRSMRFRGPDAEDIRVEGSIGFGHTLLRTTFESEAESQPCTLDGETWIVADARVDGRADLIKKLESKGQQVSSQQTDPELILHAYSAWGADCLQHLIGDYAFAIWDRKCRRLFCARDPFGVKPFYYALTDRFFVFSNTLACLRLHPGVSDELDERAVGDFLLFGHNQNQSTTTFADIRRLPAAHSLTCADGRIRIQRYWQPPTDGHVRYQRPEDYFEHFRALFRQAVSDRLRTRRAGVLMSGGMDSTAIAAVAQELLRQQGGAFSLNAYTTVYDRLIPDDERHYAQLLADSLKIPLEFSVADDCVLYEGWERPECRRPEPVNEPDIKIFADQLKSISNKARILFTGWDGDALLNESPSLHFARKIRSGDLVGWLTQVMSYKRAIGRRPPLGLRTALAQTFGDGRETMPAFPPWLNPDFAKRIEASARMVEVMRPSETAHAFRPRAFAALSLPAWTQIFEFYDPGATRLPLEARYPLVDLRLVKFLLSLPPVPYCMDKHLLRSAMRGTLPEAIRLRPKTTLAEDPKIRLLKNGQGIRFRNYQPSAEIGRFVNAEGIFSNLDEMDSEEAEAALRVVSLDRWVAGLYSSQAISQFEEFHEHQ